MSILDPTDDPRVVHVVHRMVELGHCFGRVGERVDTMKGTDDPNEGHEASRRAIHMELGGARHWLSGLDVYRYAAYNGQQGIVSLVVPHLAKWRTDFFGEAPVADARFHFAEFKFGGEVKRLNEYSLVGQVLPLDMIHFDTDVFCRAIERRILLNAVFQKDDKRLVINLDYSRELAFYGGAGAQ